MRNCRMTWPCIVLALSVCAAASGSAQTPPKWRLVEEWRKGGEAEGAYSFDRVIDLKALPGGRLVVLDRGSLKFHIFDSTGTVVRSSGGRGSGPGEFRVPQGVAVAPNGSIVVNDPQAARYSVFAPNGDFVRQVSVLRRPRISFLMNWDASFDRTGRLLASVGQPPRGPATGVPAGMTPFADSTLLTERWTKDFEKSDSSALCGAPLPVHRSPTHYALPPDQRGGVGWLEVPFTAQRPYLRARP